MASDDEKRESERVKILGDLHSEIMVLEAMVVREISLGGALIETRSPLHLNSLHELRLALGGRSIVVKGRVVHSRISDIDQEQVLYRSGVEFVEPAARVCAAIADYIEEIKESRRNRGD